LLLVLKVEPDGTWAESYYGPFASAKALSRYSARDNKHMIATRHLAGLAASNLAAASEAEIDALFEDEASVGS
jgi:hypothetical protein